MSTLRHQVHIDAPIDIVWEAIAGDLTAVRHYNPTVSSVLVLGGQAHGVGAARRCELVPKGFVEERVWEWTPARSVGLEVTASEWPIVFMRWKTELASDGHGTSLSQEMSYRLKFGPVGALLDTLVMRRRLDQSLRAVFSGLKRYVERGAPHRGPSGRDQERAVPHGV